MITRRSFSKGTILSAAAATTPFGARLALGSGPETDAHFFVYVQVFGAWDVCLAIDPKNREETAPGGQRLYDQPYAFSEVQEHQGIRLAPDGFVLAPYADRTTIINGIDMLADNGHIPDAAMTGIQNPRGLNRPFLQAIVASKQPYVRTRSIPHLYLSYDGQFFAGSHSSKSINTSVADFANLFGAGGQNSLSGDTILPGMLAKFRDALGDQQSKLVFNNYLRSVNQADEVATTLRDSGFQAPSDPNSPDGIGNFLGLLFKSGVLGSATLSFGSRYSFDTHSNHYDTHPLRNALNDIGMMIEELRRIPYSSQESIYDRTTFVVTGEYARTPLLNSSQGKDHNFRTNSALIVGKNARSAMYGLSGARMENGNLVSHAGLPVDFETGQPSGNGNILTMKDVWAGSGRIFGVDLTNEFGTDARPVKFL